MANVWVRSEKNFNSAPTGWCETGRHYLLDEDVAGGLQDIGHVTILSKAEAHAAGLEQLEPKKLSGADLKNGWDGTQLQLSQVDPASTSSKSEKPSRKAKTGAGSQ